MRCPSACERIYVKSGCNVEMIDLQNLQVRHEQRLLLDIEHLQILPGESVAIIGPNGAGKSTLFKVLSGFMPVSSGRVSVLGHEWGSVGDRSISARQVRQLRAQVGQVWQALPLVNRLTVLENVMIGALARPDCLPKWRSYLRWYPDDLKTRAWQALGAIGLQARAHQRADRLSGGERQKVAVARIRLQAPRLILADEPTAALDPQATLAICELLREFASLDQAQQTTLITVVHNPALLPLLAKRVIALVDGKIVIDQPTDQLSPEALSTIYESREPTHHLSEALSAGDVGSYGFEPDFSRSTSA
jgi:phosphonate transport system ATP-binding protein